jgi:hypothetical protein
MAEVKETKDNSEMVQTEVIYVTRLDIVLGQIEMLKQSVINMAQEIEIKQKE